MFGGRGVVAMFAPTAMSMATASVVVGPAAALVMVAATAGDGWAGETGLAGAPVAGSGATVAVVMEIGAKVA